METLKRQQQNSSLLAYRSVSLTDEHDLIWYGAVATFEGQNPIYPDTGNITGL
jgi:hypothetical protein